MPNARRSHRRWRGRQPALRWQIQDARLRARGERDAYVVDHSHFWCDTDDGVRIAGTRLGHNADVAVVLAHGFLSYRTKPRWRLLAEELSSRFTVFAFDLRGHGQSGGACTGGEFEARDVRAVVEHARARGFKRIVTVGGSLGGIAVLNAAAAGAGDAVVAISTPALWGTSGSKMVRRMTWLFVSPLGRALAHRVLGTRIALSWADPPPPADVVAAISPRPLLLVHGRDDHFFPATDAEMLYERAREPKRLLLIDRFGHAEDGFTAEFAARLAGEIEAMLEAAHA